jgi:CheY-like chemotaxis protein
MGITIPARRGDVDLMEAAAALAGRAVLVVEDEFLVALMVEDLLTEFGCRVVGPVASLAEAIELARTAAFDMAILDVNLGRGETSEPVAEILACRGAPFLFTTGYGPQGVPAPFRDRTTLAKPVLAEELASALLHLLVEAPPARGDDPLRGSDVAASGMASDLSA